jgi:hypothetical protein
MELIQFLIDIFSNQDAIFKVILLILIGIYGLFALILAIQIRNLNRIINQIRFSPIFTILASGHLVAALALLLFSMVFL